MSASSTRPAASAHTTPRSAAWIGRDVPAPPSMRAPRASRIPDRFFSPSFRVARSVPTLRRENAERLVELDFPGYAVGGLAVGEPHDLTCEIAAGTVARLPQDRPRYLMGVGKPEQLADYVRCGVDMMDCVLPTRNARNGWLYTRQGPLHIKNAPYAADSRPASSMSRAPAWCAGVTRARTCATCFKPTKSLVPS